MRATGLQGDTSAEIIEIIDDDTDVFGGRVPDTTVYDTGGPRWVGPAAAAVLIAIIGWSVATSASDSGPPKVAPAPSTSVAPTTTVADQLVPYYAADPPRGMAVQSASMQRPQDNYYGPSTYQLWAKPGATADSESWFSVESYPGSGPGTFAIDAYRVQADHLSIAVSRTSSRQAIVQFSPAGKASVTMTASGLSDEDIARIAEDVRVVRNIVQFSDRSAVAGYEMLSTEQPWAAVQGIPIEQLFYAADDDPFGGFGITVSQRDPSSEKSDLDRETALRFLLEGGRILFDVDGNAAVAGEVIGQENYSLATWTAGDHIVTLSGSMPAVQLVAMAQKVHQISPEEWSGVVLQAAGHRGDNNFGNYDQSSPLPVSSGTDSNAEPWKIDVAIATFGDRHQVVWQWDSAGFGTSQEEDRAKITSVVDDRRTYVLAELPRTAAATAQLQVLRDGSDPVLVPFADPDPEADRTFAAYVFSEPEMFTAQIIGADGAVLANWAAQ